MIRTLAACLVAAAMFGLVQLIDLARPDRPAGEDPPEPARAVAAPKLGTISGTVNSGNIVSWVGNGGGGGTGYTCIMQPTSFNTVGSVCSTGDGSPFTYGGSTSSIGFVR